jgi:hypothetical protein
MPSDFPRSPILLKGALVVFETSAPVPTNVIVFQYNPDAVRRTFAPQATTARSEKRGESTKVVAAPTESFSVEIEIDATDQLEQNNVLALTTGIHPTLAALELLLYPPSSLVILDKALALVGSASVTPLNSPRVLFVWGPLRVVPVRVTAVSINEQAFDQLLNPIRATVTLSLSSLTETELKEAGAPFDTLGLVQLIAKEALARLNVANSVSNVVAGLSF